jgi:hypothetical protein
MRVLWDSPEAWVRSPALKGFPARSNASLAGQRANDFFEYIIPIPLMAPGASGGASLQLQEDADFELISITGVSGTIATPTNWNSLSFGQQILVGIQDNFSQRNLAYGLNANPYQVSLNCICGDGNFPHILPVPRRFMRNTSINFNFLNPDSAANVTGYLALCGRKIFTAWEDESLFQTGMIPRFRTWRGVDGRLYQEDWFAYNFALSTLTAGATQGITVVTDAFSDFEWINTAVCCPAPGTSTGVTSGAYLASLTAQIQDGRSQRNLFSQAVPVGLFAGAGRQPFTLPQSRVFPKSDSILMTLQNIGASTINTINIVMEGRKIFALG